MAVSGLYQYGKTQILRIDKNHIDLIQMKLNYLI
jgi:hypothetical protein